MWGGWRLLVVWAAMRGNFVTRRDLCRWFGALCALEGHLVGNLACRRGFATFCPLGNQAREALPEWLRRSGVW